MVVSSEEDAFPSSPPRPRGRAHFRDGSPLEVRFETGTGRSGKAGTGVKAVNGKNNSASWAQDTRHYEIGLPPAGRRKRDSKEARRRSTQASGPPIRPSEEVALGALAGRLSDGDMLDELKIQRDLLPSTAAIHIHNITLTFRDRDVEDQYLAEVAARRWPVLMFIVMFDLVAFVSRFVYKLARPLKPRLDVVLEYTKQFGNMIVLYVVLLLIYSCSKRYKTKIARHEEAILTVLMATAITLMLRNLPPDKSEDYVLFAFFLICISTFMQVRWWLGTICLAVPTALSFYWHSNGTLGMASADGRAPRHLREHVAMAWSIGCLMSYLAETYRRQMFANHKLAADAAARELMQAKERIKAQRDLSRVQREAATRLVMMEREKASNEAKSEFMSLMCHEVRTPLNGCLASAEMLLDSPLTPDQFELASTIRVSGSILLSTVSNFLDYFKLEAGKQLDVVRQEVNLRELVHDIHLIIHAMIDQTGDCRLKAPDMAGLPEVVLADADRVRGVLLNLMTNAAKFTKRGYIAVRVTIMKQGQYPVPENAIEERDSSDDEADAPEEAPQEASHRQRAADRRLPVRYNVVRNQRHSYICRTRESFSLPRKGAYQDMGGAPKPRMAKSMDVPVMQKQGRTYRDRAGQMRSIDEVVEHEPEDRTETSDMHSPSAAESATAKGGKGRSVSESSSKGSLEIRKATAPEDAQGGPMRASVVAAARDSEDAKHWLVFEVVDTGVGIPPGGLKNLFNAFVQGSEEEALRPRSTGGTGLGLSICSKQVAFLGGCIGAHSLLGDGSTFWFSIPLILPERHASLWTFEQYRAVRETLLVDRPPRPQDFTPTHLRSDSVDPFTGPYGTGALLPLGVAGMVAPESLRAAHLGILAQQQQKQQQRKAGDMWGAGRGEGVANGTAQAHRVSLEGPVPTHRVSLEGPLPWDARSIVINLHSMAGPPAPPPAQAQGRSPWPSEASPAPRAAQQDGSIMLESLDRARGSGWRHSVDVSGQGGWGAGDATGEGQGLPREGKASISMHEGFLTGHGAFGTGGVEAASALYSPGQLPVGVSRSEGSCSGTRTGASGGGAGQDGRVTEAVGVGSSGGSQGSHDSGGSRGEAGGRAGQASARLAEALSEWRASRTPAGSSREEPTGRSSSACAGGAAGGAAGPHPQDPASSGKEAPRPSLYAASPLMMSPGRSSLSVARDTGGGAGPASAGDAGGVDKLEGVRVLLVEDNHINQKVACKVLRQLNVQVQVAQNGLEALEMVAGNPSGFDVVLMDMLMPEMNGLESTRAIRDRRIGLPILAMTANAGERDRKACREAGMTGFISKPVLKNTLVHALLSVMRGEQVWLD